MGQCQIPLVEGGPTLMALTASQVLLLLTHSIRNMFIHVLCVPH